MSYLGEDVPKLGFGLMRLPNLANDPEKTDIEQVKQMVDAFMAAGGRYFDTARMYGSSESDIRQALVERYPRESFMLASKNPAWRNTTCAQDAYDYFNISLKETGAGYFDYYLLHNLGEKRTHFFDDYDMWSFLKRLKEEGKIKHIGFSTHDTADAIKRVLNEHPEMEFVQIQVNYADWEDGIVQARKNFELCQRYNKPVIIMEPVRGGLLANPPEPVAQLLREANPDATPVEWAMRFCLNMPNLICVLSGASSLEQMQQNIATWKSLTPLSDVERATLAQARSILHELLDNTCTSCRYCMKNCPMNINIPGIMKAANSFKLYSLKRAKADYRCAKTGFNLGSSCIACGQCEEACPQRIKIIERIAHMAELCEGE